MPQPYPKEFRDDVIRVVQTRDSKTTIAQIAKDFGVHEGTIAKWLRQADIDAGNKPGKTTDESAELRELRRRTRLLEQENEVLRRAATYLSQAKPADQKALPARERARRRRDPRGGVVPGLEALTPALLPMAGRPCP
jgi:transposase